MRLLFADGSIVPLGKGWRYAIGGRPMTNTPRSPWDAINGAGTLYNAMIAPPGPIGLAGVAWYQGESDTGLPGYGDRLRALMPGWRHQAGRPEDRKSVVGGKSVSVRVDLGGRRIHKKK